MTQEDKILLLKDLCARLPYGVKCQETEIWYSAGHEIEKVNTVTLEASSLEKDYYMFYKPYLFPLSSLTKEQRNIISNKLKEIQINNPPFGKIHDSGTDNLLNNITLCAQWLINYYDENHLDHRRLIEKGLAINAQDYPNIYNDYDK